MVRIFDLVVSQSILDFGFWIEELLDELPIALATSETRFLPRFIVN